MNEFANVLEPSYVIRRDRLLPGRFGMDYVGMTYPVQIGTRYKFGVTLPQMFLRAAIGPRAAL